MSYRCDLCNTATQPNRGMLRHILYRHKQEEGRNEIDHEYKVCQACKLLLDGGTPLAKLIRRDTARYPHYRRPYTG